MAVSRPKNAVGRALSASIVGYNLH